MVSLPDDPLIYEFDGWSVEKLQKQRSRAHFLLAAPYRYVSIILVPPTSTLAASPHVTSILHPATPASAAYKLICMDSPCYHAAGPLGEGDLVEVEDLAGKARSSSASREIPPSSILCIRCPWHRYLVSLNTGEEVLLYPAEDGRHGEGLAPTHRIRTLQRVGDGGGASTSPVSPPVTYYDGEVAHVRMGKKVQRLHKATLDEESGTLTIFVQDCSEFAQPPKTEEECHAPQEDRGAEEANQDPQQGFMSRHGAARAPPKSNRKRRVLRENELKSDGPAMNVKTGGICLQIQDIKAKGFDQL